jgi:hypothetical protein
LDRVTRRGILNREIYGHLWKKPGESLADCRRAHAHGWHGNPTNTTDRKITDRKIEESQIAAMCSGDPEVKNEGRITIHRANRKVENLPVCSSPDQGAALRTDSARGTRQDATWRGSFSPFACTANMEDS